MTRNAIRTVAVVLVTLAVVGSMAGAGFAAGGQAIQGDAVGATGVSSPGLAASAAADSGGNSTYTANYSGSSGDGWSATVVEDHDAGTANWTLDPSANVDSVLIFIGTAQPLDGYPMTEQGDGTWTYNQTGIPEAGEERQIRYKYGLTTSRYFNHTYGATDDGNETPTAPAAPTNLTATNTMQTTIDLAWDHPGTNVSEYAVSLDGAVETNVTATSATLTGLTADTTYDVEVNAVSDAGVESSASNAISVTTDAADDGGSEGTTYSGDAGQGWTATVVENPDAGTANWTFDPNDDVNFANIHIDTGYKMTAQGDGTYTYTQSALPSDGEVLSIHFVTGPYVSSSFEHTYGQTDDGGNETPTPPAAPTGLSATGTTDSSVNLTWTHSGENVSEYAVYVDGSPTLNTSTTGANVTGLAANTSYEFAVAARNDAGNESSLSGAITETTEAADDDPTPTPPVPPTNLTETGTTTSSVAVSWDHPGTDVSEYVVRVDGSAALNTSATSANVTGLASNTTYDLSVTAVGEDDLESNASDAISVTTDALSLPETSLSVAVDNATVGAGNQTQLAFDLSATQGTAYGPAIDVTLPDGFDIVDRSDANATWNDQETTWLWTSLAAGDSVSPSLTVEAPDSAGNYTVDAVVTASSDDGASDTAIVTVEAADDGGGDGNASDGIETTYNGSNGAGWTATVVEDPDANTATWTFDPNDDVGNPIIHFAEPGSEESSGHGMTAQGDGTYTYTQSDVSSGDTLDIHFVTTLYVGSSFEHTYGDGSDGGNGTPSPPAAPADLTAADTTSSSVALSWSHPDPASVSNYIVYVDGEQATEPTETSANVTGLAANTTYDLKVAAATDDGNESDASSTISATTDAQSTQPAPLSLGIDDATVTAGEQVTVDVPLSASNGTVVAPAVDVSVPDGFEVVGQSSDGGAWNAEETTWLWLTLDGESTVTPSLTLEAPEDTGDYALSATATDAADTAVTVSSTIAVEAEPAPPDDGDDGNGGGGFVPLPPDDDDGSPSFLVLSTDLATAQVGVGDTVSVDAQVENVGTGSGEYTATLAADGEQVASNAVQLDADGGATVTLSTTFDEPGTYELTVDGEVVGTVTVTGEADLTVTDVSLGQSSVETGEPVSVTATVENVGSAAGEMDVPVSVAGETIATESVSLDAGASTTVTIEHTFETSGSQSVSVAGEQVGTVDVSEPDQDDGSGTDGGTTGGDGADTGDDGSADDGGDGDGDQPAPGVVLVLIALLAGTALATRRSGE